MTESTTSARRAIKVGVITDITGPLSFAGIANANVARIVIDDINSKGGLLGRQIELCLEDSATNDSVAEARARKLAQQDQADVILGGIYSSTRQAIKGPAVVDGKKLYIYPEQYEGQECHGRARDRGLPHIPRHPKEDRRVHPEPGDERASFPVSRGHRSRCGTASTDRAGEDAG